MSTDPYLKEKRKETIMEIFKKTIIPVIIALLAGFGINVAISKTETGNTVIEVSASIELAETQVPATIETEEGEIEIVELPTVEAVDSANITNLLNCGEDEEECGRGLYIYAPTETPQAFKDYTLGQCFNTDGAYNEQCWDFGDLFWQNYAGRRLSTCGTGAAKGTWEGDCKYVNAGDEFELITDPSKLQAGDWVAFNNGTWGHIGMALGGASNGYISLLGQNQGGGLCEGSTMGGRTNIINISLKNFAGAFRPKAYAKPEPTSEPEPEPEQIPVTGCVEWGVKRGDTMSKIMLECENTVVYGEAMDAYAKTWYSRIVKPGQSVYDGWQSESGVGLYAGDIIDHDLK